jgi:protein TonB
MAASVANTLNTGPAGPTVRALVGGAMALAVTLWLFWVMSFLIEIADRELDERPALGNIEFVRLKKDEEVEPDRRPPEPPERQEPPPELPRQLDLADLEVIPTGIRVPDRPVARDFDLPGRPGQGFAEGDYLPMVKVVPVYPQRALSRGIEGFCVVQYTVTRLGTTRDPFVIEDQCTSSLFHRASIDAALKFKYKPRVIDGAAVEVPGVQNQFTYEIEE